MGTRRQERSGDERGIALLPKHSRSGYILYA